MFRGIILLILGAASVTQGTRAETAREHGCYSTAETRDKIVAHGLSDPFRAVRATARSMQAEAIGVKLCHWSEDLVYEISLLRREGHLVHVFVDAKSGAVVGTKNDR